MSDLPETGLPAEMSPSPAAAEATAEIADGVEHPLDPDWVIVTRIAGAITSVILALLAFVGAMIALFASRPPPGLWILVPSIWIGLVGLLAFLSLVWPAVRYRHIRYRLNATGIRIRRGVIWRSEVSVPRSRVQHTDVSQGPVERGFGLATLIIHTAGTEHASVSLGGLRRDRVDRIRDYLIGGEDDESV